MEMPIYLDYNATTPVDPRVRAAMLPYLGDQFGNPLSSHAFGHTAWTAVERARRRVADLLGCTPEEIIFTSGGSKSDNLAIQGVAFASRARRRHIITSAIEHPAVLNTCGYLSEQHGFDVTYVVTDRHGRVSPDDVRRAVRPDTVLISIMHANNETGTRFSRSRRSAPLRALWTFLSILTPPSRSGKSRRGCRTWASISSRSRAISSTPRRGSAPSTCGRASTSSRSSLAVVRSAG